MQSTISVIAVAFSGLALLIVFFLHANGVPRAMRAPGASSLLGYSTVAVLLPFLGTLLQKPPFTPGIGLGWGFAFGGALGLLILLMAGADGPAPGIRVAMPLAAAALGPGLALWLFRGYPTEVLMGCAIGAIIVAVVGGGLSRVLTTQPAFHRILEIYGIATVATVTAVQLAIEHFPRSTPAAVAGGYWALPILLVAIGALALIIFSGPASGSPFRTRWVPGILGAALMITVIGVLQYRLFPLLNGPAQMPTSVHPHLAWLVLALGVTGLSALLSLIAAEERHETTSAFRPLALTFGLVLTVLITAMLTFRQLQGYGEALALLPALLPIALIYLNDDNEQNNLTGALGIGAITLYALFMLSRLLFEQFGHSYALDFQRYYDALALLLGVGIAVGLTISSGQGVAQNATKNSPRLTPTVLRLIGFGVVVVCAPLGLAALWGPKTLTALLIGLAVGEILWMVLAAWTQREERTQVLDGAPHMLLIAMVLMTVQLSPLVLKHTTSTAAKIVVAIVLTGMALVWVMADTLGRAWQRKEVPHA